MSEEKNNSTPVANPGGSNQAPEDALADKLAEQADAVTSGLRDLLPDSKAIGIEDARPVATEVETALHRTRRATSLLWRMNQRSRGVADGADRGISQQREVRVRRCRSPAATQPDLPRGGVRGNRGAG